MYDLILKNGMIVDGSGKSPYCADLCVKNEKIAKIAPNAADPAVEVIDVSGKIVAPGFIDTHTHSDPLRLTYPNAESKLMQGVTLELVGNCGGSLVPRASENHQSKADAHTVSELRAQYDKLDMTINIATLIGHGTLRNCCMGNEMRDPTEREMKYMQETLRDMIRQGAFGLSLGLIYDPGLFSKTEEFIELAKVLAEENAILAVHMRNENAGVFEAVDEMLHVAEETGVHLHISHIKIAYAGLWGKSRALLDKIEAARQKGSKITCDQYPYDASFTSLGFALLPKWAHEDDKLMERMNDKDSVAKMKDAIATNIEARGGADRIMISRTCGVKPEIEGKKLSDISRDMGLTPADAVPELIRQCGKITGGIFHSMGQDDIFTFFNAPYIAIGSDGSGYVIDKEKVKEHPHPRSFGTFPCFLRLVRDNSLFPIEKAIYKMTGLAADILRLKNTGRLIEGYDADITVFDYPKVRDLATFEDPIQGTEGIEHVFVSGRHVLKNGAITSARPGRFINFSR